MGNAPVIKVHLSHAALSADNVVDAIDKNLHILQLRPEHFLGENGVRVVKNASEECGYESGINPIVEPVGEYLAVAVLEILAFLEIIIIDQELRVSLLHGHAAPDFGHEEADVVIHAKMRADVAGGGNEALVSGQEPGNQSVV